MTGWRGRRRQGVENPCCGLSKPIGSTWRVDASGCDLSPPLQPQPDLLLDFDDREKHRAHRDDQQTIGQRDGFGSQHRLQRRQVGDRKLGRCDDEDTGHVGRAAPFGGRPRRSLNRRPAPAKERLAAQLAKLTKSLEQRARTILKVASEIVRQQDAFLAFGVEFLRPLNLKTVAEVIGMHESTISRVTSGKYLHTPRGVFELRYFFSSQVEGDDGAGTSSTAIRAKIRKLIRDEPPEAPLSDGRIAELLSAEGIPVARRTVAKYREALGLASSAERKRVGTR